MLTTKNRVGKFILVIGVGIVTSCTPAGPRALLEGRRLVEQGKYAEAVDRLKIATSLLATNANAWNYLGVAYHRAGQATNAAKAYQKALKLDPDLMEVRYNLGCLWLELNHLEPAKVEFTTYTLRRGSVAEGWLKLGTAQLRSRELVAAEKSFSEALRLKAQNAEALNGLGLIQLQRNRAKDAAQYFAAALKQETNYAPALLNLAVVSHQYLNNRSLALQKYTEYLALSPRPANAEAVSAVVRTLKVWITPPTQSVATGSVAQASQTINLVQPPSATLTQVVAAKPAKADATTNVTKPPSPPAPANRATNLEVVKLPEPPVVKPAHDVAPASVSAAAPAERVSSVQPASAPETVAQAEKRGFFQRMNPINLFRRQPKPVPRPTPLPPRTAVIQTTETKVTVPPTNTAASAVTAAPAPKVARYAYRTPAKPSPGNRPEAERAFAQGVQSQRANRLAEAVQAYRQATQVDPSFFEAHYNLGLAAYEARNLQQSLVAYENALTINPASADARYNFALALREGGYVQDAANELEKLLTGRPEEARAHFALANLYAQRLDQPQSARRHYLKVLEIEPRHAQATAIRYWLAAHPE